MTLVEHQHPGSGMEAAAAWWPAVPLLLLVALLAAGYLAAAARTPRPWPRWRTVAWLAGCAALAAAVATAGTTDPSGHMAQHLILGMYAPLGLVLAAPVTLLLRTSGPRLRRAVAGVLHLRAVRVVGHPATATLLSVGVLYLVLLTPIYAAAERQPWLHHALHVHYLLAGCLFVWAIAGPDQAPKRPGTRVRAVALFVAAAAHAYLAKRLYAHAGAVPPGSAYGHDEAALRAAAELMYYGGYGAELLLAVALFGQWYRRRGHRQPAARSAGAAGQASSLPTRR